MNKDQKKAIESVERAFKKLKKEGIEICGMNGELYYATNEAIKNSRGFSMYCDVANAVSKFQMDFDNEMSEHVGKFKNAPYEDSGGW